MTENLSNLLKISDADRMQIYKKYEITPDTMKTNIDILRNWIKKSEHLPQNQDNMFLENVIIRNKCRVEQVKEVLENYYSMKTLYNNYFNYEGLVPSQECAGVFPVFKKTPNHERIIIFQYKNPTDATDFIYSRFINQFVLTMELLTKKDFSDGYILIADCRCTIDHLKKINIFEGFNGFKVMQDGMKSRFIGMYLLNCPKHLGLLMQISKLILPGKLHNRIYNYDNKLDELYKTVPKECLPEEFGGTNGTLEELKEQWDVIFAEHQTYFEKYRKEICDESKRIGGPQHDMMLGVDGTFKSIAFD